MQPLSSCVLWVRFFVCFAGRHKELSGSLAHLVGCCHTWALCCSVQAAAETRGVTQHSYLQLENPPLVFLQMKYLSFIKCSQTNQMASDQFKAPPILSGFHIENVVLCSKRDRFARVTPTEI